MFRRSLLFLLFACHADKADPSLGDTGAGGYSSHETGLAQDSGTTPVDTAGTTSTDTGDTGTTTASALPLALSLAPEGLTVHPGATWQLRLVGSWDDGLMRDVKGSLASSDEAVVEIQDGAVAHALAAGEATLTATWEGLEDSVAVVVTEDGAMTVTVTDSAGSPLKGLKVKLSDGEEAVYTNPDGQARLAVGTEGQPLTFTVYGEGYVPLTVWSTVSRAPMLVLHTEEEVAPTPGLVAGDIDFDGVPEGGFGDLIIGLALPGLPPAPLTLDPDTLLSERRPVTLYGIDTELPSNIFIRTVEETYKTAALPGPAAAWTLAAAMPVADVTSGVSGATSALELLEGHLDGMAWGWVDAGTSAGGGEVLSADLAPATALEQSEYVDVGELPLGFSGDEKALVLLADVRGDGEIVPTGFGLGTGSVTVHDAGAGVAGGSARLALAVAQVGGLGSGGATCASMASAETLPLTMPELPAVPDLTSFDKESREFVFESGDWAWVVHLLIEGGDGAHRELYAGPGLQAGGLPDPGFTFAYGNTSWRLLAIEARTTTFEELVSGGGLDPGAVAADATTACRVRREF